MIHLFLVFVAVASGYLRTDRKPPPLPPGASVPDLETLPSVRDVTGADWVTASEFAKLLAARSKPAPADSPSPVGECVPVGRFVVRK